MVLEITFFPKNIQNLRLTVLVGWSGSRKRDHVQKLRKYNPIASDDFAKPKNSGRKKDFQKGQRSEEQVIVLNRIEENNLGVEKEQDEI